MNLIVTEKNDAAAQIARLLSDAGKPASDKVYNTPVYRFRWNGDDCVAIGLRGHILEPDFPDALRRKWFQPREYGYELCRDRSVRPIGQERQESIRQQGPVEYPKLKRYRQWYIYNGHLLLCETRRDTLGNQQIISTDTADIVFMRRDTLQLRFATHEQGYYRRGE